jgi:ligand-binding sensor domain-containing protein
VPRQSKPHEVLSALGTTSSRQLTVSEADGIAHLADGRSRMFRISRENQSGGRAPA